MPYIKQNDRSKFSQTLETVSLNTPSTAGELNYLITKICHEYLNKKGKNYQNLNDIMGALTGVQLELYRRITAPYEDLKIEENGDV